jgi:hypothetical protein
MKVTLESTDKIVELTLNGQTFPARVWEGETANGIKSHAYITRISVHESLDATEFERELREVRRATPAIEAIPLRLIL